MVICFLKSNADSDSVNRLRLLTMYAILQGFHFFLTFLFALKKKRYLCSWGHYSLYY